MTPEATANFSAPNGQVKPLARDYVATLRAALDIAATRLLTLIAMMGAVSMFAVAAWDPQRERTIVAGLYAAVVLCPMVWALSRKG